MTVDSAEKRVWSGLQHTCRGSLWSPSSWLLWSHIESIAGDKSDTPKTYPQKHLSRRNNRSSGRETSQLHILEQKLSENCPIRVDFRHGDFKDGGFRGGACVAGGASGEITLFRFRSTLTLRTRPGIFFMSVCVWLGQPKPISEIG